MNALRFAGLHAGAVVGLVVALISALQVCFDIIDRSYHPSLVKHDELI
jgi:hypothetical protein